MDLHLKDKVVVVTGGAAGIGRAIAEEFLREGAQVVVFGRGKEKLESFLADMKGQGFCKALALQADVTKKEQISALAEEVFRTFGRIDVWVNNAGVDIKKMFLDYSQEDWDRIVGTNLDGVWNCTRIAAPYMMKQGEGVFINISSYTSKIPHAGGAIYAATKAAVSSMTKTLAAELAPYNIRVVGIIPGMIKTNISTENIRENHDEYVRNIAMKRLGVPEDLAKPAVFLASDAAQYISGVELEVAGGKYASQNTDWPWKQRKEVP
ncbi:MAG: 3-oxoacyl-ACP reductase FabG [Lachnospiraceae bacterium]|nr:3-oxoacyl-ACP reductase FabG [Lachnospiraceae bacterium]